MFEEVDFSKLDLRRVREQFGLYSTYVRLHEWLVAYYANALCKLFGIDPMKVGSAAIYHDHSKFLWDKRLMINPLLSKADWEIIKRHPKDSVELLYLTAPEMANRFSRGDPSVNDLIYLHHERPDGNGYYGITDLPLESVILSIADIFDACFSDRPYRKALPLELAIYEAFAPYEEYLKSKGYSVDEAKETLAKSVIPKPRIDFV